jgi:hypothetical protein
MASTGMLNQYEYKQDDPGSFGHNNNDTYGKDEEGEIEHGDSEELGIQSLGSQFLVKCGVCMEDIPVQQYKDHAAICKLSMSLKQSEFAIPITHGETRTWKKTKFQGHAAPVRYLEDVEYVIHQLSESPPWSLSTSNPCAYRLAINAAAGAIQGGEENGSNNNNNNNNNSEEATILEGRSDGNDPGVGDKLLYLLQRWEVQNVVIVVTAWDDGMKGRLGAARYRIYLEEAKAVLEQCYLESLRSSNSNNNESGSNSNNNVNQSSKSITASNTSRTISNGIPSSSVMFPSDSNASRNISDEGTMSGQISSSAGEEISNNHGNSSYNNDSNKSFKGTNFAEVFADARARAMFRLNRPTKPMKRVLMQADTMKNFPKEKLVNGFHMGEKVGRPNHFLADKGDIPLHGPIKPKGNDNSRVGGYDSLGQVELPNFTRKELDETRNIIRPSELVHRVFFCVCKILGYEDNSWPGCREMMSSDTFLREIVLLDPSQVPMDDIDCVRNELMERNFAPERIRRHSLFAANMLTWCIKVVQQFDFITAGIKPPTGRYDERNSNLIQLHKGREVISVAPRKLTLGQGMEVSRVMGKTPMKKPVTAPLYERNDVGPARANVPRLKRYNPRINTEDGVSIRGQRDTYRSSNSRNSARRTSRGKSGKNDKRNVRVSSRMTNRSSVSSSRGNAGELDKW